MIVRDVREATDWVPWIVQCEVSIKALNAKAHNDIIGREHKSVPLYDGSLANFQLHDSVTLILVLEKPCFRCLTFVLPAYWYVTHPLLTLAVAWARGPGQPWCDHPGKRLLFCDVQLLTWAGQGWVGWMHNNLILLMVDAGFVGCVSIVKSEHMCFAHLVTQQHA